MTGTKTIKEIAQEVFNTEIAVLEDVKMKSKQKKREEEEQEEEKRREK